LNYFSQEEEEELNKVGALVGYGWVFGESQRQQIWRRLCWVWPLAGAGAEAMTMRSGSTREPELAVAWKNQEREGKEKGKEDGWLF
jgi:hypothetical protein